MKPTILRGNEPSNVLEVATPSTAVLIVMRRPAMVRSRDLRVQWLAWCQVAIESRNVGLSDAEPTLITVPAYPPRRRRADPPMATDELCIPPLPSNPRAVAVAYYPLPVKSWRFEFYTDQHQDPDATAEAWAFPIQAQHADCGFFRTPHRKG